MKFLKRGSKGPEVEDWQNFLNGVDVYCFVDGDFGPKTEEATKIFQKKYFCEVTGVVDRPTMSRAVKYGYVEFDDDDEYGVKWPSPPSDIRPMNESDKKRELGAFTYEPKPTDQNPEKVDINNAWERKNIHRYEIPELVGVIGYPRSGVYFHEKVGSKAQELFRLLKKEGLIDLVLTWNGSYATRFIRGSRTRLSNHAYGSAFDINVSQNRLGAVPALVDEKGSVRKIVPVANRVGFWWGGHFSRRKDGMHFELAIEK